MILFIDTHDELITIGLEDNDKLFIKTKESEYSHSIFTMPMIKEIFEENNLNINDLDKVIVVNGPGSFTGIRIGLTIAKTLAYTLNIKINTISSLLAYLISNNNNEKRMAVIEDNKGYYVSAMDENNNIILKEQYIENNNYDYKQVEHKLDLDKIIDYCNNLESENYHHIKANYIKKIEVEK